MRRLGVLFGAPVFLAILTFVRLPAAGNAGQPPSPPPSSSVPQVAAEPLGGSSVPKTTLVAPRDGSVNAEPLVGFTATVSAERGLSMATLYLGEGPRPQRANEDPGHADH